MLQRQLVAARIPDPRGSAAATTATDRSAAGSATTIATIELPDREARAGLDLLQRQLAAARIPDPRGSAAATTATDRSAAGSATTIATIELPDREARAGLDLLQRQLAAARIPDSPRGTATATSTASATPGRVHDGQAGSRLEVCQWQLAAARDTRVVLMVIQPTQ